MKVLASFAKATEAERCWVLGTGCWIKLNVDHAFGPRTENQAPEIYRNNTKFKQWNGQKKRLLS